MSFYLYICVYVFIRKSNKQLDCVTVACSHVWDTQSLLICPILCSIATPMLWHSFVNHLPDYKVVCRLFSCSCSAMLYTCIITTYDDYYIHVISYYIYTILHTAPLYIIYTGAYTTIVTRIYTNYYALQTITTYLRTRPPATLGLVWTPPNYWPSLRTPLQMEIKCFVLWLILV